MVIVGTGIEFICEEGRRKWKVKKAGKGKAAKEGKVYDQGEGGYFGGRSLQIGSQDFWFADDLL